MGQRDPRAINEQQHEAAKKAVEESGAVQALRLPAISTRADRESCDIE